MSTFTFEPGLFADLTAEQRLVITRVLRLATTKTVDAHGKVPRTAKGIEAQTLIVDANDMLMDLHTAVQESNREFRVDGTLYKTSHTREDGTDYITVLRWESPIEMWRMQFSVEVEDGETKEQARERAEAMVRVNHDRAARPAQYTEVK